MTTWSLRSYTRASTTKENQKKTRRKRRKIAYAHLLLDARHTRAPQFLSSVSDIFRALFFRLQSRNLSLQPSGVFGHGTRLGRADRDVVALEERVDEVFGFRVVRSVSGLLGTRASGGTVRFALRSGSSGHEGRTKEIERDCHPKIPSGSARGR
jgi:hypothetical protein